MKWFFLALFITLYPFALRAQTSTQKGQLPPHPNLPASQEIETEKVVAPGPSPAGTAGRTGASAVMEPEQVKALMHKLWLAEYRLSDLLTQVHPEKWKMPGPARQSFEQGLGSLHKALAAQEAWRAQLEARPDNLYLGFEVYVAIGTVLPPVDGVAYGVTEYENASFGAQFSQAAHQLYDLQQVIESHLEYLLKTQDGILLATQANLASCQNELNFAEHNKEGRATPMKNVVPVFKGRGGAAHAAASAAGAKQATPKGKATGTPAAKPPDKTQKK